MERKIGAVNKVFNACSRLVEMLAEVLADRKENAKTLVPPMGSVHYCSPDDDLIVIVADFPLN